MSTSKLSVRSFVCTGPAHCPAERLAREMESANPSCLPRFKAAKKNHGVQGLMAREAKIISSNMKQSPDPKLQHFQSQLVEILILYTL